MKVGVVKVKEGQVKMDLVGSNHTDLCERACLEGVRSLAILLAGIMRWSEVGSGEKQPE